MHTGGAVGCTGYIQFVPSSMVPLDSYSFKNDLKDLRFFFLVSPDEEVKRSAQLKAQK